MRAALPTAASLALALLLLSSSLAAKPRWQLVYSEVNDGNAILSLDAVDANTAWAVGISTQMSSSTPMGVRTTDGVSWSSMGLPQGTGAPMEISLFTTLAFSDAQTGWIGGMRASFTSQLGLVWRTSDGGMSWQEVFSGPNIPSQLQAFPGGAMFAAAGPVILASPDGQQIAQFSPTLPAQTQLNGISMLNDTCGYAVASIPAGEAMQSSGVLWTEDGGQTWELRVEGLEYRIERVSFVSPKLGWAAGARGDVAIIASTADGGRTWTEAAIPDHPPVMGAESVPATSCADARFFDDKRGVGLCLACTGDCEQVEGANPSFLTVFVRSNDGGRSWQFDSDYEEQMAAPPFPQLSKFSGMVTMDFAGPNAGFIAGENNLILRYQAEQPEPDGWGTPGCTDEPGAGGSSGGTGGGGSSAPGASSDAAESDSGCGCRVSPRYSTAPVVLGALSLLMCLFRMRHRRSR